ncbi:DEKNAAC103173 [Brettanomyces naardenensis]|uniref:DEKNAAC103173 n=1 Tax=Brettanomyces naardenensis TaxID=13370 RepID=A0A448YMR4_BRENA|nr:DEKNAAC103173 [Brettanomyces naardenensis]
MPKTALIIIDLQNDYFPRGKWVLDGVDTAARNAARLLDAARKNGDLVVHIYHENVEENAPFFVPGTDGAKINKAVLPLGQEHVVLKHFPNSFRETGLKGILDQAGATKLTIVGAMAQVCVDATTRAAADFGYQVTVISDAVAARSLEFDGVEVPSKYVKASFLGGLAFAYADVITTEEFLGRSIKD